MAAQFTGRGWMSIAMRVTALVASIIGLTLLLGGAYLLSLHGSPSYALCGSTLCASAMLLWRQRVEGAMLLVLLLGATIAWALWEVGLNGWALWPRIGLLAMLPAALTHFSLENINELRTGVSMPRKANARFELHQLHRLTIRGAQIFDEDTLCKL
jgi:quinate dehydrogenase (quinone)